MRAQKLPRELFISTFQCVSFLFFKVYFMYAYNLLVWSVSVVPTESRKQQEQIFGTGI